MTLEEERRALAAFVSKFDSVGLGLAMPPSSSSFNASKIRPPMPTVGGAIAAFAERRANQPAFRPTSISNTDSTDVLSSIAESPVRLDVTGDGMKLKPHAPLMLEQMPEEWSDVSFEIIDAETPLETKDTKKERKIFGFGIGGESGAKKGAKSPAHEVLGDKENLMP